jgi:hypothetical protein
MTSRVRLGVLATMLAAVVSVALVRAPSLATSGVRALPLTVPELITYAILSTTLVVAGFITRRQRRPGHRDEELPGAAVAEPEQAPVRGRVSDRPPREIPGHEVPRLPAGQPARRVPRRDARKAGLRTDLGSSRR